MSQPTLDQQLAALDARYPPRSMPPGAEIVRVAPSPTGLPHLGTALQAIIDFALARQSSGRFILRIEDSDRNRLFAGADTAIREALDWLRVTPDEGPALGGAYGPYLTSERMDTHHMIADWLVTQGAAYPCYCSTERVEALRAAQQAAGQPPRYDRHCRWLTPAERAAHVADGATAVIRLAMPLEGTIVCHDLARGQIVFGAETQDDPVLLKSDGFPTYHLAAPVDDHFMGVTLVVRGEEWISSIPKYLVLYQALGWDVPKMVHTPLLRDAARRKLSKRMDDTSLRWFRAQGYPPEALRNWLTRIIWAHPAGKDVYPFAEFIQGIDPAALPTTGPVADMKLLDFISNAHLRQLDAPALFDATDQWLHWLLALGEATYAFDVQEKQERRAIALSAAEVAAFAAAFVEDRAFSKRVLALEPERYHKLGDIVLFTRFFYPMLFAPPTAEQLRKATNGDADVAVTLLTTFAREYRDEWSEATWHDAVRDLATAHGIKPGAAFMLWRVAVTGSERTPPLYPILQVLGAAEVQRRLALALSQVSEASVG